MAKNCLAVLGLIVLSVIGGLAMMLLYLYYTEPAGSASPTVVIQGTAAVTGPDLGPVETLVGGSQPQWTNPLESQPVPQIIPPTETPTPTPVPPLDPVVYRTETMIRARSFGDALEAFVQANEELGQDNLLLENAEWRSRMLTILEQVSFSGQALAEVGPPPAEYEAIDAWFNRVGPEAQSLEENYRQALDTRDAGYFTAAGDNFTRIREYLYQALEEVGRAGWPEE